MDRKIITDDDFSERMEHIQSLCSEPSHGIFGPESMMWRISKETFVYYGSACSVLLQNSNEIVGTGLGEHSSVKTSIAEKHERRLEYMHGLIFGDLDTVLGISKRLFGIHKKVTGVLPDNTPYRANDTKPLLWVAGTTVSVFVILYERYIQSLTPEEKEEFLNDTRKLLYCFGVSDEHMPKDWKEFENFIESNLNSDGVLNEYAKQTPDMIFKNYPLVRYLDVPFTNINIYEALTAGLLPEDLRKLYGMKFGPKEKKYSERFMNILSKVYPYFPKKYKYMSAYTEAVKRIENDRV